VTDLTGRQVLAPIERITSGGSIDIPSSSLAAGEYLVVVEIDGKRDVRKLVVIGE
jgi:hypothetical protein